MSEQDDISEFDATIVSAGAGADSIATSDLQADTLFASRYRIHSCLGRGGMGVVYKATDTTLKRTVAIKVLQKTGSATQVQRFQLEARVIAQLHHPNVIRIYEVSVADDQQPFLVMDCVEGHTLAHEIKQGRLQFKRAMLLLEQCCSAIAYAHSKGIVHRDIKPSNLMIVRDENAVESVKLLDFGLAKFYNQIGENVQQLTRAGEIFGSPYYISPEQISSEPVDERTDIYSLGCVFYEMITGMPPFRGKTALETFMLHKETEPQPLACAEFGDEFTEQLNQIVFKMIAKSPDSRFQSVTDLMAALSSLVREDEDRRLRIARKRRQHTTRLRLLKVTLAIIMMSLAVLAYYSFVTITDGIAMENLTPDVLTRSWKDFDYEGQQAFDKGKYDAARTMFDKALIKARMDWSSKREHRISMSLFELISLCDVAKTPIPSSIAVAYQRAAQGRSVPVIEKNVNRIKEKTAAEIIDEAADMIAMTQVDENIDMLDLLQRARAKLTEGQPVSELDLLKLRTLELDFKSQVSVLDLSEQRELEHCIKSLQAYSATDKAIARDWRWCCIVTDGSVILRLPMDLATQIALLEKAAKFCVNEHHKLKCNALKAHLVQLYEGEARALSSLEQAIRQFERSETLPDSKLGYALVDVAERYLSDNQPQKSLPLFLRARRLSQPLPRAVYELDLKLAYNYCDLDRSDEALKLVSDLEEQIKRNGRASRLERGRILTALGYVHGKRREFHKAESCLLRSIDIYRGLPDAPYVSLYFKGTAKNLATLYSKMGRMKDAQEWTARAGALPTAGR